MRKHFYLFLLGICCSIISKAAPGDTTWVQANITDLPGYGSYDTTITFPSAGTSYRNIYMIFTLGKYTCPSGSTWCGDWDYTVQNFLMTPGGDTLELGRLITPYANAGAPRTPWAWQQHYVYDVTDYAAKLKGSAAMRIFYSGYSGGFTANIRFAFVEGTPDRNVTEIKRLWHGSFGYGGTPDINVHFPAVTTTAPEGTQSAYLKFTVTGHGSDANGCCEFLSKNYNVKLNGIVTDTKAIWKACGMNNLYPQSGTWLYDRANWCPGELTNSNFHLLPGIAAGSSYGLALEFEPYSGGGSYTTEATLISYGGINKSLDASIEQIIAPTNDENNFRVNPACGTPTLRVKNRGSAPITSIKFEYGLKDSVMLQYTWTGSLASLQQADIVLPELQNLNTVAGAAGLHDFQAKILQVNGAADDDASNDVMTSQFVSAPLWPSKLKIVFKTNNEPDAVGSTTSETKWQIMDINNNVVASRTSATISALYVDTVYLPTNCYKLVITDGGCDGLHWWVWDSNPSAGIDAGYLYVRNMSNVNLPMNGYQYSGTYNNDFGCGFTQYFYVNNPATAVTDINNTALSIDAYPNPAQNTVNVDISGLQQISGTIQIVDVMGRIVSLTQSRDAHQQINIGQLNSGVYTILFVDDAGNKLQTRLLVTK